MVSMDAAQSLGSLESLVRVLRKRYRVVDLSEALVPGVLEADGHYHWSQTPRRYELRQWTRSGAGRRRHQP